MPYVDIAFLSNIIVSFENGIQEKIMLKNIMNKMVLPFCFILICLSVFAQAQEYQTKEIRDIVYKKIDGREIKLNLFLPMKDGRICQGEPLLIQIDSGCWYSKGPGNGGLWRSWKSVERGYAVASVSHRSIGDGYAMPTMIEDVRAAVRYLRAHAKEYGYDSKRVAALGTSSGGHLVSMMGIPDKFKIFDVGDNLDQPSQVQAVINFYSIADMEFYLKTSPKQAIDCIYLALGGKKEKGKKFSDHAPVFYEAAKKFSPMTYVDKDFAPTLTLQGSKDPIVLASQSLLFYEALNRNGVRTDIYIGNGGVHSVKTLGESEKIRDLVFDFLQW